MIAVLGVAAGVLSCILWERVLRGAAPAMLIPLLHNGVQAGSAGLLVIALATRGWAARALTSSSLQLLGMMCFSIYVWHGRPIEMLLGGRFSAVSLAAYVAAVGVLAAV